jgi:hypothetical protein
VKIDAVHDKVLGVLNIFFNLDSYLLNNNLNERTISHKLGCYLSYDFSGWDVDCEYNRNHDNIKRLDFSVEQVASDDTTGKTVFPDIIIHRRATDENLLVIEIKKDALQEDQEKDLNKIAKFIEQLSYKYGLFINFRTGNQYGINELVWVNQIQRISKLPSRLEPFSIATILDQVRLIPDEIEMMR